MYVLTIKMECINSKCKERLPHWRGPCKFTTFQYSTGNYRMEARFQLDSGNLRWSCSYECFDVRLCTGMWLVREMFYFSSGVLLLCWLSLTIECFIFSTFELRLLEFLSWLSFQTVSVPTRKCYYCFAVMNLWKKRFL